MQPSRYHIYIHCMDVDEVGQLLRDECRALGGARQFAEKAGVSHQMVYWVMNGARKPRGKILDALGLEAVVVYRRKASDGLVGPRPRRIRGI